HFERKKMPEGDRGYIASVTPANWAQTLLGLRQLEHARELDPVVLNGRKTAVFQIRDLTVWADMQTKLPVRMESEKGCREVYEDFRWDEPLGAHVFEPVIPADYPDKTPPEVGTPAWFEKCMERIGMTHSLTYDTRATITMDAVPDAKQTTTG